MSVEDWARREAARQYGKNNNRPIYFADGIVHAFSALLSDEAVEAAAQALTDGEPLPWHYSGARAALQAAVDAVTEGDTE